MSTAVIDVDHDIDHDHDDYEAALDLGPRGCHPSAVSAHRVVRLTRRGRLVILLLAMAATFGAFTMLSDSAVSTAEQHPSTAEKVIVEPGQSLWDIASEIAPGEDPRDVISEIVDLNALESSGAVQAGQLLFIPQY